MSTSIHDDPQLLHHARAPRPSKGATQNLKLTSMIDIVFLLLIYFVVTTSFAKGEGVLTSKLPRPMSNAASAGAPTMPLRIVVSAQGQHGYRLNVENISQTPASFSELTHLLEQYQYDPARGRAGVFKPTDPVDVVADPNVRWQHVVNAVNAARAARFADVHIEDQPNLF